MRRRLLALAIPLITVHGCSHGPTAPRRSCRNWPLQYSYGSLPLKCEAGSARASCSAFPTTFTLSWGYRSRSDFVHEADVPNRVLALEQSSFGCGSFVTTGCNRTETRYAYDSQARLVRRERTWSQTLGAGGTTDVVTWSAWDRRGRPTQGRIERDGRTEDLQAEYDDALRVVRWSNGDAVVQDAFGNVIREIEVRNGGTYDVQYSIESYQQVCEDEP